MGSAETSHPWPRVVGAPLREVRLGAVGVGRGLNVCAFLRPWNAPPGEAFLPLRRGTLLSVGAVGGNAASRRLRFCGRSCGAHRAYLLVDLLRAGSVAAGRRAPAVGVV